NRDSVSERRAPGSSKRTTVVVESELVWPLRSGDLPDASDATTRSGARRQRHATAAGCREDSGCAAEGALPGELGEGEPEGLESLIGGAHVGAETHQALPHGRRDPVVVEGGAHRRDAVLPG